MHVRYTQSSRRHRIGRAHTRHVIESNRRTFATDSNGESVVWWVGPDDRYLVLEVMGRYAVDANTGEQTLLVMHVMPVEFRR